MTTTTLSVSGLSCQHCVMRVKNEVSALTGVKEVRADLAAQTVTVEFDAQKVALPAIKEAIAAAGYTVNE